METTPLTSAIPSATTSTVTKVAQKALPPQTTLSDLDQWVSGILESSSKTVQALLFFITFLIVGGLCKKYFRFIAWGLVITLISIKWLEYQDIIAFNWPSFYQSIGIPDSGSVHVLFTRAFDWIKNNPINFTSGLLGFLIGYRPNSSKGVAIKIAK